jgi:hypothetical protein
MLFEIVAFFLNLKFIHLNTFFLWEQVDSIDICYLKALARTYKINVIYPELDR